MLKEVRKTRQIKDEMPRRWFTDNAMDLIVWFGDDNKIAAFQLCYDKPFAEHALSWRPGSGFTHNRVDDGEGKPGGHKGTPLLVPDGEFNLMKIAEKFKSSSAEIDNDIAEFIYNQLNKEAGR